MSVEPDRQGNATRTVATEALKYTTRTAFSKGSDGAYYGARRLGIMDDVCGHMVRP